MTKPNITISLQFLKFFLLLVHTYFPVVGNMLAKIFHTFSGKSTAPPKINM